MKIFAAGKFFTQNPIKIFSFKNKNAPPPAVQIDFTIIVCVVKGAEKNDV